MSDRYQKASCIVCRNSIPPSAQKCSKCDSYQDWRRHVFVWTGLVSAILGIAPAWGIAVSLWVIAFPGDARLSLTRLSCRPNAIQIAVSNSGGRAGLLANATLVKSIDSEKKTFDLDARPEHGPIKIGPQDVQVATYLAFEKGAYDSQTVFPLSAEGRSCYLELTFPIFLGTIYDSSLVENVVCPCVT